MTAEAVNPSALLDALRASHARLVDALEGLSEEEASGPSYDDDWSIGQVASHLGSGAEIFAQIIRAGLRGDPLPGGEEFKPVWAVWDAKPAGQQVQDVISVDEALLALAEAMTPEEQQVWQAELFGAQQDLAGVLRMRLGEHALHTWDIAVMSDPELVVASDAAALIVDNLATVAGRSGRASEQPRSVEVRTTDPERAFHLDLGTEGVQISPSLDDTSADAELTLPAESFVRLVYGRLDPDHTPDSVTATGVDLDQLRDAFPGI